MTKYCGQCSQNKYTGNPSNAGQDNLYQGNSSIDIGTDMFESKKSEVLQSGDNLGASMGYTTVIYDQNGSQNDSNNLVYSSIVDQAEEKTGLVGLTNSGLDIPFKEPIMQVSGSSASLNLNTSEESKSNSDAKLDDELLDENEEEWRKARNRM
tara:strand:- start:212 stop:670 length:459 start_codon:yes stop_codon:yes gene_type:complete